MVKTRKILISVVTTAFNESNIIENTIMDWHRWLKKRNFKSEIIVYDDGSPDKTYLILPFKGGYFFNHSILLFT